MIHDWWERIIRLVWDVAFPCIDDSYNLGAVNLAKAWSLNEKQTEGR